MRKILFALTLCTAISLFSTVPAYAADVYDEEDTTVMREVTYPDGQDTRELIQSSDLRYQNNMNFMESRPTSPERLKLFLRPSIGIDSNNAEIITLADTITKSATNDYDKAQLIHNWVSTNIYYDWDAYVADEDVYGEDGSLIEAQNASYVLKDKKGVCEGYSNLTCALLRAVGIPAQRYTGWADGVNGWEPHAWTGAYISSQRKWIVFDSTFDSSNRYADEEYVAGSTRQTYFNPDLHTFSQNHLSTTTIFDNVEVDEEVEQEVAELYGKDANLDFKKKELYFYFDKSTMGKYSKCQYAPGFGKWDTVMYFDESWVSSNPKVATVDQYGNVTALECGTTTISLALQESGMLASFELTVTPQKLSLYCTPSLTVGETYKVATSANNFNDDGNTAIDSKSLTWSSSNTKVLTVDTTGKITAVGVGTAKITATLADGTSVTTDEIKVNAVLSGIHIEHKTLTVKPNSEVEIEVIGSPDGALVDDQYLAWESSNPKVADVYTTGDGTGLLSAYKEGTTTITAYIWGYASNDSEESVILFSDTFTVTVVKQYKVIFKENGGTTVKDLSVKANTTITKPTAPTRKGYKFVGWYKNSKCSVKWNFSKDKITAKTTLYAKWHKI